VESFVLERLDLGIDQGHGFFLYGLSSTSERCEY
jgi:hypothetical protein